MIFFPTMTCHDQLQILMLSLLGLCRHCVPSEFFSANKEQRAYCPYASWLWLMHLTLNLEYVPLSRPFLKAEQKGLSCCEADKSIAEVRAACFGFVTSSANQIELAKLGSVTGVQ